MTEKPLRRLNNNTFSHFFETLFLFFRRFVSATLQSNFFKKSNKKLFFVQNTFCLIHGVQSTVCVNCFLLLFFHNKSVGFVEFYCAYTHMHIQFQCYSIQYTGANRFIFYSNEKKKFLFA